MSSASFTPPWDVHRLPRAEGSVFLITGGNAGIGYFIAEQLSTTGATVVLGSRDPAKAEAAMASIRSRVPDAHVRAVRLDLADLRSLGAAAESLAVERLDAVVHNAGVALDDPPRRETQDGHEVMFGTNHLGHFALTARLMPLLSAAPAARIVTVGSFAAKSERLDLDDLQSRRDYRPKRTYGRSTCAPPPRGCAPHPPPSSSRASTPARGPRSGRCSTRPWPEASCGDRASSACAAHLDAKRCGATSPTPRQRRACGTPAAT